MPGRALARVPGGLLPLAGAAAIAKTGTRNRIEAARIARDEGWL